MLLITIRLNAILDFFRIYLSLKVYPPKDVVKTLVLKVIKNNYIFFCIIIPLFDIHLDSIILVCFQF